MLDTETAGARDFRRDLTRYLVAAEHGGKTTIVTRNGQPAAALVPYVELRGKVPGCGLLLASSSGGGEARCSLPEDHAGRCR